MVLPWKITVKGGAVFCAVAVATRPEGAPFTEILRGERISGTEDGPRPDYAVAVIDAA